MALSPSRVVPWWRRIGRTHVAFDATRCTTSDLRAVIRPQAEPVCRVELALRVRVWDLGRDRFMVAGSFGDLAVHHHPAVQVTVGVEGPVTVIRADGGRDTCRLVVVASGTQHAVRSDARSAALSIYLGPATREGIALNALSHARGQHQGVWVVGAGDQLANAMASQWAAGGPRAAANFLVHALTGKSSHGSDGAPPVHPQLRHALELVSSSAPGEIRITSVAGVVAGLSGAAVQTADRVVFFGHHPMGAAAGRLAVRRWRRVSHRCRARGGICRRFPCQPGVLGTGRLASERFRAGAHRFAGSLTAGRVTGASGCQRCALVGSGPALVACPAGAGRHEYDGSVQATATSIAACLSRDTRRRSPIHLS
jgi:hypothetical protein